jgi:acyl-CoA synthetase (AMP-forming)/AMP-acid ligase II
MALVDRCEALGIAVTRGYGSTEHPSISSAAIEEEERALRNRFDGRVLPGVEARTIDLNDGRPLPPGDTGEIVSRGPDLFAGYLDAALTRAGVDDEGWSAPGDIGVVNPQGWVAVTDRRKDIIIRGGENISAAEVGPRRSASSRISRAHRRARSRNTNSAPSCAAPLSDGLPKNAMGSAMRGGAFQSVYRRFCC